MFAYSLQTESEHYKYFEYNTKIENTMCNIYNVRWLFTTAKNIKFIEMFTKMCAINVGILIAATQEMFFIGNNCIIRKT